MIQEYDVVRLKKVLPSVSVPLSTRGAVLRMHDSKPPTCDVEFIDDEGNSFGTFTLKESDLKGADSISRRTQKRDER